jgi:CRP/FNR family cyclic AMP-dependent transcriptional regulator
MSRLLDQLADDARRSAARALASCPVINVPAGRSVELPNAALIVVEQGVVVLTGADARRIVIALAGAGEVLAPPASDEELSSLTGARVTALSHDARRVLMRIPAAAEAVTDALVAALRERKASLTVFAHFPHIERVRGKLMQLARSHGRVTPGGILIDLPLTHDLIADSIGSSRETVTLALHELTRSGFVARVEGRYRLSARPEELV